MDVTRFDYIVVGAGAAGCTLAARLSENPDHRVLLLEAGAPDDLRFRIPGLGFMVATNAPSNWNFMTEPNAALEGRTLKLLSGKVLGGSSSINGMQYSRGHSGEYDAWEGMGCEGWGWAGVLPYFRKAEGNARGASVWHGGSGPLKIRRANPHLPICDAFLAAASNAGFPIFDDMNTDVVDGFGYSDINVYRGLRMSSASAYLRPAMQRKNLTVMTRAQALRIVIENGRASGVDVAHAGKIETLSCEREVILCAGAIKSPHLLLLSGIGPADQLSAFGIPVVVDAPNVGKNLQNHACYRPQYACSAPVTAYQYLKPVNVAKAVLDYALFRKGPLGDSYVAAGGLFRSDSSLTMPDVQVTMIVSMVRLSGKPNPRPWDMLPKEEGFSLTIHATPFSRGDVALKSADPLDHPRINANYFSDPRDMETLLNALERMRDVTSRPPIRQLIRAELMPGDAIVDRAALAAEVRRNGANAYHPVGTCAMGPHVTSVVDPQLRVRGVEGLRVADNAVLPTIPNAGLHAPAIMVAEKAAAMIASPRAMATIP